MKNDIMMTFKMGKYFNSEAYMARVNGGFTTCNITNDDGP